VPLTAPSRRALVLLALAVLLAACASAQLTSQWKAPDGQPQPLRRVLVVALTQDSALWRETEGGFVRDLQQIGAHAVAAHAVLPASATRDDVRAYVERDSLDGVLAVRVLSDEFAVLSMTRENVPDFPLFYDLYSTTWPGPASTTFAPEGRVQRVDVRLYEGRGDARLLWRAVSESFEPRSTTSALRELRALVVDTLEREGLL
jgi:hypothetical protein